MSSSDAQGSSQVTVPFFRKGKSRPTTSRKRSPQPAAEGAVEQTAKSQVVLASRKTTGKILSAGTKRTASKLDEEGEEEEKEGPGMKWTAEGSHVEAAREIIQGDEAEEMLAKRRKKEQPGDEEDIPDDGLYRGQKGYQTHLKKRQEIPKAMRVGPQRNTSTIRTVTIVDYQPDVCKDYKGVYFFCCTILALTVFESRIQLVAETGYCGFGDTCKFLHDRGTCE
jgi:RING finger protein 113A